MSALRVLKEGSIAAAVRVAILAEKAIANGIAPLDASQKVPAANSLVESVANKTGAVVLGVADVAGALPDTDARIPTQGENDALQGTSGTPSGTNRYVTNADVRNADSRTPTAHKGAHEPGGTDALTALTDASFAAANKDGLAATPSLRTLGTGGQQAAAGNDARLSDARTPTDGSVTAAKMAAANKAIEIVTSTTRPASPVEGQHIYETDTDATLKNTGTPAAPVWSALGGGSSSAATETVAGTVELATQAEVDAGTAGAFAVTPDKLKASYGFAAKKANLTLSVNMSVANATITTIAWDTETADPSNWHDSVNPGRITPGKAGTYLVTLFTAWQLNGTGQRIQYLHVDTNGAAPIAGQDAIPAFSGSNLEQTVTYQADLPADNSFIYCRVYQDSTVALSLLAKSRIVVQRIA